MNRRNFFKRIGYAIAGGLSLPFLAKAKPNASPIIPAYEGFLDDELMVAFSIRHSPCCPNDSFEHTLVLGKK